MLGAVSARRATADVVIQIVVQATNVALGVVVTAVIARQLGTTRYGEWATIFSVIGVVGFLSDLNLQDVAVRQLAGDREHEREWLGAMVALKALLTIPVFLIVVVLLELIARGATMRLAGVILAMTLLLQAASATQVAFVLRIRNDLTMAILTANSLIWTGSAVVITLLGGGMVPFAIAFTGASALAALATTVLALRWAHFELRGVRARWRMLATVGFTVGLSSMLGLVHGNVDQVLVYELAPHRVDAGLYGGLYRIATRATAVPVAVVTTMFPMLSGAIVHDRERAQRLVQAALESLAMLSIPALAFSLVGSRPLLRLVLGPQYVAAAGALPILMGAYVVICWGYVAGKLVIVLGRQRRFMAYVTIGLALNVALNVALIPRYGYVAAAWITVVTETTVIGLTLRMVLTDLQVRLRVARLARLLGAGAVLALLLLAVRSAGGTGLVPLVSTALVVYPALLLGTRALRPAELRALVSGRAGAA